MPDIRMQGTTFPPAPPKYDPQNEASFRQLVGMLTSRVDNAMQRLQEDTLEVSAGHFTGTDQTGVAVTAADIHAALVNLGLITA